MARVFKPYVTNYPTRRTRYKKRVKVCHQTLVSTLKTDDMDISAVWEGRGNGKGQRKDRGAGTDAVRAPW